MGQVVVLREAGYGNDSAQAPFRMVKPVQMTAALRLDTQPQFGKNLSSTEQSENVYENKGTARKSTTPIPSLFKEGNLRTPLLG